MLLEPQTISSQPETAKDASVTLECPRCYWLFEVTQPDSKHPKPTYNKNEIRLFNEIFLSNLAFVEIQNAKNTFLSIGTTQPKNLSILMG